MHKNINVINSISPEKAEDIFMMRKLNNDTLTESGGLNSNQ